VSPRGELAYCRGERYYGWKFRHPRPPQTGPATFTRSGSGAKQGAILSVLPVGYYLKCEDAGIDISAQPCHIESCHLECGVEQAAGSLTFEECGKPAWITTMPPIDRSRQCPIFPTRLGAIVAVDVGNDVLQVLLRALVIGADGRRVERPQPRVFSSSESEVPLQHTVYIWRATHGQSAANADHVCICILTGGQVAARAAPHKAAIRKRPRVLDCVPAEWEPLIDSYAGRVDVHLRDRPRHNLETQCESGSHCGGGWGVPRRFLSAPANCATEATRVLSPASAGCLLPSTQPLRPRPATTR
jgi:hypothetical protein